MNFIRQIERFQALNKLIHQQCTGTPDELASRLGISRRQLYAHIEDLKVLGLEISYSRKLSSFYFNESKHLKIEFNLEVLEPEENIKTFGGKLLNLFPCFFYARNETNLAV
ncbi:HTH domain-containing protein [Natronoflexus pectinivorans]|uniref:HTH domain-containing protein n=1 Tax=Natronoflexus pectinivorans TaxID=682526 RepID=A0A4R2GJW7_9BACT|nr:HTH domain-containing protein [Natronoflexus pectinivorans]TCO08344.1 HTH domain-containing protein [Natronoflexus pectinivorans]